MKREKKRKEKRGQKRDCGLECYKHERQRDGQTQRKQEGREKKEKDRIKGERTSTTREN